MRNFFLVLLIPFLFGCDKTPIPTIQLEHLSNDWIIRDSAFLFIEDSVLITNIFEYNNVDSYKYWIENDSLTLEAINPFSDQKVKAVFKIHELSMDKLVLKFAKEIRSKFFVKPNHRFEFSLDRDKKNDKIINLLELSSSNCLGRCPSLDLKITEDSLVYFRGYSYTKHLGFYKHKLTPVEFYRINSKFNRIELDSLELESPIPDAQTYSFRIVTSDTTINAFGLLNYEVVSFTIYLINLERILEFEKADSNCFSLTNDFNRKWWEHDY